MGDNVTNEVGDLPRSKETCYSRWLRPSHLGRYKHRGGSDRKTEEKNPEGLTKLK